MRLVFTQTAADFSRTDLDVADSGAKPGRRRGRVDPLSLVVGTIARADAPLTFWVDQWLRRLEGKGGERTRFTQADLIVEDLGHLPVCDLTLQHVQAFLRSFALAEPPYHESTIKSLRGALRNVVQEAVDAGAIDRNVVKDIRPGWKAGGRIRDPRKSAEAVIDFEHYAQILDPKSGPMEIRMLAGLGLLEGLRMGEACALMGFDIAPAEPLPQITVQRTRLFKARPPRFELRLKNGATCRRVPLHPMLAQLLEERGPMGPGELVAPRSLERPTEPWNDQTALTHWRTLLRRARVPKPIGAAHHQSFGAARHSFISNLAHAGAAREVVETFTHVSSDHSSTSYETYLHLRWSRACEEMLKLGGCNGNG